MESNRHISIANDFLFGKIMQNPELCKELLHRILPDSKIDRIEYPELQKTITPDMDARSIRLDVYVKDNKNIVYDIEMQVSDTKENSKWRNESMALLMRDRENQKIGKIFGAISVYKDFHLSDEDIVLKLQTKFDLTEEQANAYLAEEEQVTISLYNSYKTDSDWSSGEIESTSEEISLRAAVMRHSLMP